MAPRADLHRALAGLLLLATLAGAAPAPRFDTGSPPAFAQPRRDAPLDPVTAQLAAQRLVQLHLLDRAADAQDPDKAAAAIKGFQASVGLKATGLLDRKTLAMLAI